MRILLSGFCLPFFLISQFIALVANAQHKNQTNSNIKISFIHAINSQPLVLHSTKYANHWDEIFTVSRLSYYISNVRLQAIDKKVVREKNSYHLINEEEDDSKYFSFSLPPDQYTSLSFLIGVDSLKNVSGAQTGALDPLNGMFWTWNTGYIMFKMEGYSQESSIANQKIEYHIGGFSGINNALRNVQLNFSSGPISIDKEKIAEITIRIDLDKIWKGAHDLKIAKTAVCTSPGALASSIADNYSKAFEIIKIIYK